MFRRKHTEAEPASAGGGLHRLGEFIVRKPGVVIAFWIALAAVLSLTLPTLTQMVRERPLELLPANAPVTVTTQQMTEAFHESGLQNILLVVLTDDDGLTAADEDVYRTLVERLRKSSQDVVMLQDFITTPPLREATTSKDGKAWYLPIGLAGTLGSAEAYEAYTRVAAIVHTAVEGSGLTANLTGPAATVADASDVGEADLRAVEIATVVMVLTILLIVYRSLVTMLLPLLMIGLTLAVANGLVSAMTQLGLGISNQTIALMSALIAGAGTDYAVFLISRYHEYLRLGEDSDQAVIKALASIGKVIAASAGTVAITFLGMIFTRLGLFQTIGPALAVSVAVAFLAAMTFLPAVLVLAGRRGWVRPRKDLTSRFWRRSGIQIVRHPKTNLVASSMVLVILAGCGLFAQYNWDDRKTLPADTESNRGYVAMDEHFSLNSTLPQYLFIQSPNDLRTPKGLADLEQMAQRVSQVPGVTTVRGITRPTGESLEQARATFQAGEVGNRLNQASTVITDHSSDLDILVKGSDLLADTLGDVRGKVTQAMSGVGSLIEAMTYLQKQFGGTKTLGQIDDAAKLVSAMRSLGSTIGVNLSEVTTNFGWADPVLRALDESPVCDADPSCAGSRVQLQKLVAARDAGALDKVSDLARQLQATQPAQSLEATTKGLRNALDQATRAVKSLGLKESTNPAGDLASLKQGADTLADGSRKLAEGVALLVDQTRQLGSGLNDASGFLLAMKEGASSPSMSGFYVPPQLLDSDEFKKAAGIFISPDGHSVRYLVQTDKNPFSTEAMDQVDVITDAARGAQPNTELADATISVAGFTATLRDIRAYYDHDVQLIMIMTIIVVLLILIALLRAVVAPLYLIGSVIISYMSALGIGVVFFQFILGQQLHWSVPGLAFIVLVAVGADYNMLLISRLRDESPYGIRSGVIRTVGSTGGVITSAGVIFAASMLGLVFGSVTTMVQAGFVMGVGLLLDTFLVRTLMVPALAVLVGKANWWPSKWVTRPHTPVTPADRDEQLALF